MINKFIVSTVIIETKMLKPLVILTVFLLLVTQSKAKPYTGLDEDLPVFLCEGALRNYCTFEIINTTKENPRFQPRNKDPELIWGVTIGSVFRTNRMEILTSDICNYFPNLEKLVTRNVKLEGFEDGALANCPNLTEVYFSDAEFTEFPDNLFESNPLLATLEVYRSKLIKIQSTILSSLPNLIYLDLTATFIEEIDIDSFASNKIKIIWLYSNYLKDFQVEKALVRFSQLEEIAFNDNDIKCSRVQVILDVLADHDDVLIEYYAEQKEREEEIQEVGGITCIP